MKIKNLASYLDLANHHPDAQPEEIKQLCCLVIKYRFNSAFVNPYFVTLAKSQPQEIKVGTVIAFPLGQEKTDVKLISALAATKDGADELDVSLNIGLFKAGDYPQTLEEMRRIIGAVKSIKSKVVVKFIIETGLLTDEEIKRAASLVLKAEGDFVKTCSGMGPRGAKLKDVELIKEAIGTSIPIKVAGGIHNFKTAKSFIEAGASRVGTSKAVEIVKQEREDRESK